MIHIDVTTEDSRTGKVETLRIDQDPSALVLVGVIIGAAEDCHVRLVAPGVTAHHVRWYPGGYHRFVEVLDADAVVISSKGEEYRGGQHLRVDHRSFRVGPYLLTINAWQD